MKERKGRTRAKGKNRGNAVQSNGQTTARKEQETQQQSNGETDATSMHIDEPATNVQFDATPNLAQLSTDQTVPHLVTCTRAPVPVPYP